VAPLLKSISLTNFRSIRGTISVPLDAPIVLIHGQNGTGKTSLLSGIELALTGSVPSLNRSDDDYLSHLVHKEAGEARVAVTIESTEGAISRELTIRHAAITGRPLFTQADSFFFSERCYLAQATMSRLLELYQGKESKKGDSALTKFVKDLLGLDQLDALVNGLHDSGHVARLKSALFRYRAALERLPILESHSAVLKSEQTKLVDETAATQSRIALHLSLLGVTSSLNDPTIDVESMATDGTNLAELQRMALLRRNLAAAREQWHGIQTALSGSVIVEAEKMSARANEELETWRKIEGERVSHEFKVLRNLFSDLADPAVVGPGRAMNDAIRVVTKEYQRCSDLLRRDGEATAQVVALDEQLRRAQARLEGLDSQIASHLADADKLAQALTGLLPHVNDQECPVCGRDFGEVSSQTLHSHVSAQISTLVESAGRLQTFVRERSEAIRLQSEAGRSRESFVANQLESEQRVALSLRSADLRESEQRLLGLVSAAQTGDQLLATASSSSRRLSDLRSKSEQATGFRAALKEFEEALNLPAISDSEETGAALARFEDLLQQKEKEQFTLQEARTQLLKDLQARSTQLARKVELDLRIRASEDEYGILSDELRAFDGKMKQARELAKIAKNVRSEIVRKVFNDSLNTLWRDLFIRLAPNESFVPAFTLPEKDGGDVEAVLETHYRSGGKGGNPRAMLSAGNLNTAALTLFLALHLSVDARFPCLIIDDPVQSMDEVHIAQLAALMRTLSRQHNRQIIIAVHEKPLFDYLTLELTPAFPGDRLITVELGLNADGQSFEYHDVIGYTPDNSINAA
jgi:DNA repair protein SbcC/Rad50